jgi:hypothetical protein
MLIFFIWYGVVRFALETLRLNNWTFFGIPTAQIVSAIFVVGAIAVLAWRHRRGASDRVVAPEAPVPGAEEGIDARPSEGTVAAPPTASQSDRA